MRVLFYIQLFECVCKSSVRIYAVRYGIRLDFGRPECFCPYQTVLSVKEAAFSSSLHCILLKQKVLMLWWLLFFSYVQK